MVCTEVSVKFKTSILSKKYLSDLYGIEIGASAHNPFDLNAINVDVDTSSEYKQAEIRICGESRKVDIRSSGDDLPFKDNSIDFVLSSHVLEHFWDPILTLTEWYRVIRKGGYIFAIIPHKDRTFDRDRNRTTLEELINRHSGLIKKPNPDTHEHYSVWITEDILELCKYLNYNVIEYQDVDDKVGNGFTIVIKK